MGRRKLISSDYETSEEEEEKEEETKEEDSDETVPGELDHRPPGS